MAQAQQQQPPQPTEEQLAVTDASFKAVPLELDPTPPHLIKSNAFDPTMINALIRSISALPPQIPVPPPPNVMPPQRSLAIQRAKDDGNKAFKKDPPDYSEAIKMYTLAIDVAASRPLWENNNVARDELALTLANRSAALLEVGEFIGALADAEGVVKLKKPWSKGHYRKGKALFGLQRYSKAIDAYELGLQFDPDSLVSID